MRKNKLFFLSLSVGLLLLAFSGCVKKGKTPREKEINFMLWGIPSELRAMEKFIQEDFMKQNPDIEVNIIFEDPNKYSDKLLTMISGGTAPDVAVIRGRMFPFYALKNILVNLSTYIKEDGINMGDYYFSEDYKYKNSYYSMPFHGGTIALYYNKDMFDKHKIKYPDSTWKWENLLSAAQKLTRDTNGDGLTDVYGVTWPFYMWYPFIWQNGGRITDETHTKFVIGSPKYIDANTEALEFMISLWQKHKVAPSPLEESGVNVPLFENQRVEMVDNNLLLFIGC